jgi:hypothetical protein
MTTGEGRERVQIPHDVIDLIIATFDSDDNPKRSLDLVPTNDYPRITVLKRLVPLCLVSKTWLVFAQRRIYRIIPYAVTGNDCKLQKFMATVLSFPHIRPYIQQLRLMFRFESRLNSQLRTVVAPLLSRCHLVVDVTCGRSSFDFIIDVKAISLLVLRDWVKEDWPEQVWSTPFRGWHALHELHLFQGKMQPFEPHDDLDCLPSLQRLDCQEVRCFTVPPTAPNTLRTLWLTTCTETHPAHLKQLISHHASSLRDITFCGLYFQEDVCDPSDPVVDAILSPVTNLENLLITFTPQVSVGLLASLPSSLVTLDISLGFKANFSKSACRKFVKERAAGKRLKSFLLNSSELVGGSEDE